MAKWKCQAHWQRRTPLRALPLAPDNGPWKSSGVWPGERAESAWPGVAIGEDRIGTYHGAHGLG